MLWALQSSPPLALNILEATHTDTYLRDYIVADSLEYISNYLLQESEGKDSEAVDNLHRVLRLVVHRRSGLAICITQKTFFLLLKYSTKEQALALFNEFAPRGVLHHYTSFRLASTLATTGEHNLAFRIIQTLFSSGFSLSDSSIRSVCLQILHSSAANGRGYAQSSDLLFQMLQMGLRPNLELYNVILLNAFEGGDHETAFNIYSTMKANGLGPDDCTYSILLKGAELTGDRDTFRKIIQEAEASGSIMGNPYILTQMLLHIRRTHSYESRFSEMLSLYKKHFETQPLLDLDLKFAQMHESVGLLERINPPPVTLGVMLVSFLERCNDLNIAWALYKQFRRQAEAGHPIISPLIESQDTCNAFILTFGRTQTTLHLCTTVIGDMLKPLAGNVINTGTGKPTQQAQPNVQTWSLLVKAFLRHGQSTAAEKIMNMMKKCGAEPNQVTWNTLVSGYSRMQNIDAAARTMKRMEMEGWGVDDYTLKGLGNVHDRQKLTAAFERLEGEQQEGMLPKDTDMMDITFHKNSSQTKTADNTYDSTYDDPPMQKAHFG
ncbi:MAG: hypothetical protein M1812_006873 [Candelaria pacifica]|nr:MAG: hypothetical protein M1812_006873 [Candelaria pacifica]